LFRIYSPGMAPFGPGSRDGRNASVYLDEKANGQVNLMLNDGTQRHLIGTFDSASKSFVNNRTLAVTLTKEHQKMVNDYLLEIGREPKAKPGKLVVALVLKKAKDGSIYVEAVDPRCNNKIDDACIVKVKPSLELYFYKTLNENIDVATDARGRIVIKEY
jgi:hypothetical protein